MPAVETAAPVPAAVNLLHLSSREVPPGGLAYKISALAERAPRDAWVGPFNSIYDLEGEVSKRCKANGIPTPSTAEIEDQICQRLPPGYCRDASNRATVAPGSMAVSLSDVISGTKALAKWFLHGSVSNEEIVRRTYICNECPENRPISGCTGCAAHSLHQVMNAIVVKHLPSDAVLQSCAVCRCSLPAKVRMRVDDLLPNMPTDQIARLPDKCWLIAPAEAQRNDPRV
jgi:hypothetical protein